MAEEQDDSQKTEDPTNRRLDDARNRGQVANSREVNNFLMLTVFTISVLLFGGTAAGALYKASMPFIESPDLIPADFGHLVSIGWKLLGVLLLAGIIPLVLAFAADNEKRLEAKLGREAEAVDLYLAHFLGLTGATNFLRALEANPGQGAASLFPKAAAANRSIFHRADGTQRSLQEIYDRFASRMSTEMAAYDDLEDASSGGGTMLAEFRPSRGQAATASGDSAIYGQTNPGGILSPFMLVTLASLPTARDRDREVAGQGNSLFNRAVIGNPTA